MNILLFTTPVKNGEYSESCGFKVDMEGSIYYSSEDRNAFHEWFGTHMHSKGWTVTISGPANPHPSYYVDGEGKALNYVTSIKRHYHGNGKRGEFDYQNHKKRFIHV